MIKLTVTNRNTKATSDHECHQESITIGRQEGCDVLLDSQTVSRKHAEIVRINQDYFIFDNESGNGTLHNGVRLKPHEKQFLNDNDVLRIEEFELRVHLDVQLRKTDETDSGIIEIKMIKKVLAALDSEESPYLEGLSAPITGKKVHFTANVQEIVIGRDSTCELHVDTAVVSRRHAVLQKKWGGIAVTDLSSKNGTFVNGEKITERELKDGDRVSFGDIETLFKNPEQIDLDALSREYEKKKEKEPKPPQPAAEETPPPSADAVSAEAMMTASDNPDMDMTSSDLKIEDESTGEDKPQPVEESVEEEAEEHTPLPNSKNLLTDLKDFFTGLSALEIIFISIGLLVFFVAVFTIISLLS